MARVLNTSGAAVGFDPYREAPSHASAAGYIDSGDLRIKVDGVVRRVEVKGRRHTFSSRGNWPRRNDRKGAVLLDDALKIDTADPPIYGFYLVSADWKAYAEVLASTRARWVTREIKDPTRGTSKACYCAALDDATFYRVGDDYRAVQVEDAEEDARLYGGRAPYWTE
jgi:hypothetical protein